MKNTLTNCICLLAIVTFFLSLTVLAQDKNEGKEFVYDTFLGTRLINTHTVEMVPKGKLDIRIAHRFGDINAGWQTLYGIENAADVRIAGEYGLTDNLTIGLGRSKGFAGPRQLVDLSAKYRVLRQTTNNSMPISIGLVASAAISTMEADSINLTSEVAFQEFAHRVGYNVQVNIARKFSDRFALQIMPSFTHRNLVRFGDENDTFALGIGGRVAMSKHIAIIFDYYHVFSEYRDNINAIAEGNDTRYYPPLGIGIEIKTGGHVFDINFSNTGGIIEQQFIPYSIKSWADGEFRLGFNISRPIRIR